MQEASASSCLSVHMRTPENGCRSALRHQIEQMCELRQSLTSERIFGWYVSDLRGSVDFFCSGFQGPIVFGQTTDPSSHDEFGR